MPQLAAIMLFAALAATPTSTTAANRERLNAALNDLAREMSTCAAYFSLASVILKKAPDADDESSISQRYATAGRMMLEQATEVANAIGLQPDVLSDWSRLALQDMVKEINADPKNSTALMQTKHDEPCKLLLDESPTRLRELLKQYGDD